MNEPGSALQTQRWQGDVLGREELADFLSLSLVEQANVRIGTERPGLTVALDADWGTGKSFFVRHWAEDFRSRNHPVVVFDAWENDIGDEAVVALMACIKDELARWTDKLSNKKKIQKQALETTQVAIKGLRRAVAPTFKVVATGLVKKVTGIAVEELFEALDTGDSDAKQNLSEGTAEALESGLDTLFKHALDDHKRRATAIASFKKSIDSLIELLERETGAKVPVFVFVDEVDRCRPTYAIRLLEEIKHIFGINKICFVISTNLDQLQESVRAIYGSGFDGHRYLKRFFDYQYTLPDPDYETFAEQLLSQEPILSKRDLIHSLPQHPATPSAKRSIALISNAFELDLRSQKQVFSMASSVAAAIPKDRKIYVLWLFYLCALRHRNPAAFDGLHGNVDHTRFIQIFREATKRDIKIEYMSSPRTRDQGSVHNTELSAVLWSYFGWSNEDLIKLRERDINRYDYPSSNLVELANEAPHSYIPSRKYPPSIAKYFTLVKYAGMVKEQSSD